MTQSEGLSLGINHTLAHPNIKNYFVSKSNRTRQCGLQICGMQVALASAWNMAAIVYPKWATVMWPRSRAQYQSNPTTGQINSKVTSTHHSSCIYLPIIRGSSTNLNTAFSWYQFSSCVKWDKVAANGFTKATRHSRESNPCPPGYKSKATNLTYYLALTHTWQEQGKDDIFPIWECLKVKFLWGLNLLR